MNSLSSRPADIYTLKKSASEFGLIDCRLLSEYPDEVIEVQYNGVGPDRWSPKARAILSSLLWDVLEAVLIHDIAYYKGGDEGEFRRANKVLGDNIRTLAKKKYGWWRPRRYFLNEMARLMTKWTDEYGWEGWTKN